MFHHSDATSSQASEDSSIYEAIDECLPKSQYQASQEPQQPHPSSKHVQDMHIEFDQVPIFAGQVLNGSLHFTLKVRSYCLSLGLGFIKKIKLINAVGSEYGT